VAFIAVILCIVTIVQIENEDDFIFDGFLVIGQIIALVSLYLSDHVLSVESVSHCFDPCFPFIS